MKIKDKLPAKIKRVRRKIENCKNNRIYSNKKYYINLLNPKYYKFSNINYKFKIKTVKITKNI